MTLALGVYQMLVAMPSLGTGTGDSDWRASALQYPDVYTFPIYSDPATGQVDIQTPLQQLQAANASNPIWTRCINDLESETTELIERVTRIHCPRGARFRFRVQSPNIEISRWWLPSDYGNYGVMRGFTSAGIDNMHWITSAKCDIDVFPSRYSDVEITLREDVVGSVEIFPWAGVPPIVYNPADVGWFGYSGLWEWFGPPPV